MSNRSHLLYCQDILESGTAICTYLKGVRLEDFLQDRMRYSAVIREFEIIGEAVGKLPADLKDLFPDSPWQEVKDFRNLLTHAYFGVDLEIVWNTAHNDLPQLLEAVKQLSNL